MLSGRAGDIKKHKWFEGLDWEALEARKVEPQRKPKDDSSKRLKELTVGAGCLLRCWWCHWWLCCWCQSCGALHTSGWCAPHQGGMHLVQVAQGLGCSLWPVCCFLRSESLDWACLPHCSCCVSTMFPLPAELIKAGLHRHYTQ